MISSLITGFLLGMGASIPIGPINILIMNEALISYRNAFFIGLGAMSADLTYLSLIFLGFISNINSHHTIVVAAGIMGSLFLLYTAYGIFIHRNVSAEAIKTNQTTSGVIKSYLKGYSLTLLNPYTIGFWISIATYVTAKNLNPSFTLIGVITAISLWITIMPFFVHKTKRFMTPKIFKLVNTASSLIILFFAISMLFSALSILR